MTSPTSLIVSGSAAAFSGPAVVPSPNGSVAADAAIRTEIVNVDPRTAEIWLHMNKKNRPVRKRVVTTYASDMAEGNWLVTGEAIKFDSEGALIDGQHRLSAIIESGKTVPMTVIYNLPPETQRVLDSGVGRTTADSLALAGRQSSTTLAAAARLGALWDTERFSIESQRTGTTRTQIAKWIEENPDVIDAVTFTVAIGTRSLLRPSVGAFCYMMCARVDRDAAGEFFARVADGAGLEPGNPILALRNRLMEARAARSRMESVTLCSLTLRAWNSWRTGREVRSIPVASRSGLIAAPQPI